MAALSSAFQERLQLMEQTRNYRLSLLQAERELQAKKSKILSSKLSNIRSMEQKCLALGQKIAFQNFKISALKSEIDHLDSQYDNVSQQLREMRSAVEEVVEAEKEKDRFYQFKRFEMKEFKEYLEKFVEGVRIQVNELRNRINELKSTFVKLQGNNGYLSNSEIAAAEIKKSELIAVKENLQKNVASNYQLRSQLQKHLQDVFINGDQKLSQFTQNRSMLN